MNDFKAIAPACCFGALALGLALATSIFGEYAIRKAYNGTNTKDKDVVLVISSVGRNALDLIGILNISKLHLQSHTEIIYKYAKTIEEISQAIEETVRNNNKITCLFVRAHGCSNVIHLSGETVDNLEVISNIDLINLQGETLTKSNVEILSKPLDMLSKNAKIALECCSTGSEVENNEVCLAQTIASLAPGRIVVAPFENAKPFFTDLCWEGKSLKIELNTVNGSNFYARFFNGLSALFSLSSFGLKNVTKQFLVEKTA